MKGKANPDQAALAELTGDSGPLTAGALPHMDTAAADGDKNAWESVTQSTVAKRKPKRQDPEPAEEVVPKTLEENCS